jgi:ribulose-bisphosphate carboxylase small chain
MRLTQGTFSYLPPLSDEQIERQVAYALERGWSVSLEHTNDPHPRNVYWQMWGMPFFDLREPAPVFEQLRACREANPDAYIRLNAFDSQRGRQTTALSFIVGRPSPEPDLWLERQDTTDRRVRYTLRVTTPTPA